MMERLCDIRYTASIETIDNGRAGMLLGALNVWQVPAAADLSAAARC
ncbi:hypothetical protein K373_06494 [Streptomyces sp. DvalAA-21]|nr:hypothetical protein SACTE_0025 [Streptomyces sp. SirexAA-E]PZX29930.1 hypothetical protein K373_06553 [Streptomyces sp. DvalAA-21]RAJ25071.1 hypothetical protein K351_06609 [Streptomyces sp. DpondAA-E10]RAJ39903.1 hypothetical protein K352_06384 [Streptomyces sp. DpondAA-A50]SCD30277.1 hypothetical protein GA0115235_100924 [Streptomyces sp. DpondAA-F4a]SCM06241.1 hypothetical protein SAMN04883147_107024 [Streptomyces sp. DpondAA-F4]